MEWYDAMRPRVSFLPVHHGYLVLSVVGEVGVQADTAGHPSYREAHGIAFRHRPLYQLV